MSGKPPAWLRICWPLYAEWPDEEDYSRYGTVSDMGRLPAFPERRTGAAPDRWIFDLFKLGMSNTEIGRRCGLCPAYVGSRLRELEQMGYITSDQRRLRHAHQVRAFSGGTLHQVPTAVHHRNEVRYRNVIRVYKETQLVTETHRRTGVAIGTVSRWVRKWEKETEASR